MTGYVKLFNVGAMDMTKKFRGVRLDEADWQALSEMALKVSTAEKRVTASDLVRAAVSDYLSKQSKRSGAKGLKRRK